VNFFRNLRCSFESIKTPHVKRGLNTENAGADYPDLKIANNYFLVIVGLVLAFGGEENSPFFCNWII